MNSLSLLRRLLHLAIAVCLIVVLVATLYGHVGGHSCGLNLTDHYVTEYMKMAPHWPWLIVASFACALLFSLLALALLDHAGNSTLTRIGCLLLAATSMGLFFVAYAPIRRVDQPPRPAHEWWTPTWWFTSQTSHTPYEHGMADAYDDVHYRATRLVVSGGVIAILLLAAGAIHHPDKRVFAWGSLVAGLTMAMLFLMGDHLESLRGLWQRLGFVILYAWLWGALHNLCTAKPKPSRAGTHPFPS